MSNLLVEQVVVDRLREWLLMKLPGRVSSINALRAASLTAPLAGPYTIPDLGGQAFTLTSATGTAETDNITAGSRTAAQIVTDIGSSLSSIGITPSADSTGRLLFTASATPTSTTPSHVALASDESSNPGMNAALGFDAGGERAQTWALEAPGFKEVMDGLPEMPDSSAGRFWVVLGDNASVPVDPGPRRDEYTVSVNVGLCVPVPMGNDHRNREHLRAAVRAVRECLFIETDGRTLGNATGIQLVFERQCIIRSRPTRFDELPNQLFGRANLELNVRVYERQGN